jgi:cytochrome c-type biogenesis protein CcmH
MIALWFAAGVLAAAAFGLIVMLSGRPVLAGADAARGVYRRQLLEIDDLAARGLLGEDERRASHAEAARRLLSEEDPEPESPPNPQIRNIAIAVAAGVALIALGLYLAAGRPQDPDQPFAKRLAALSQADPATLGAAQMEALVKKQLKSHPNDPTGLFFLAQVQEPQGKYPSAERNLVKSLAIDPSRAETWDLLGQVRVDMAKGKVPANARGAFEKALAINPKLVTSRYFLAHGDIADGKVDQGVAELKALEADVPDEAKTVLDKEIAEATGAPNVDAATVAAVSAATPANGDVTANPAILAMVAGLAERLKQDPSNPADWERLVRSYTVLKNFPARDKALADARAYFKNRPADLAAIEQAAKVQGQ